ncbi:hypothetical protein [Aerosakkonema funiforme]|uniref:hypothetical protein n=1 Tax=Aerosakkonema funiforme TaxID=1246630 RepID=UPI0035B6C91D
MKTADFYGTTVVEKSNCLSYLQLGNCQTFYNPALHKVVQPFNLTNILFTEQATRVTTPTQVSILQMPLAEKPAYQQGYLPINQDSSKIETEPAKLNNSTAQSIALAAIQALTKNFCLSVRLSLLCQRLGLALKLSIKLE